MPTPANSAFAAFASISSCGLKPRAPSDPHPSASTSMPPAEAGTSPIWTASSSERPSSWRAWSLSEDRLGASSAAASFPALPEAAAISSCAGAAVVTSLEPTPVLAVAARRAKKPPPPGLYLAGASPLASAAAPSARAAGAGAAAATGAGDAAGAADSASPAAAAACARRRAKKPPEPGVYWAAGALAAGVDEGCASDVETAAPDVSVLVSAAAVVAAASDWVPEPAAAAAASARRRAKKPPAPADQRAPCAAGAGAGSAAASAGAAALESAAAGCCCWGQRAWERPRPPPLAPPPPPPPGGGTVRGGPDWGRSEAQALPESPPPRQRFTSGPEGPDQERLLPCSACSITGSLNWICGCCCVRVLMPPREPPLPPLPPSRGSPFSRASLSAFVSRSVMRYGLAYAPHWRHCWLISS
mmetsp:Transcript_81906/g.244218  ORF Transcript_81906/g.244218 Transcript_81906/m.244218 type:complete len:416 (+) Transcript_81906:225-1472(+)